MYIILAYDVNVNSVSKIMKICREYLFHVQNSLFEGEISPAKLVALEKKLNDILDQNDSVIIYKFKFLDSKFFNRIVLGQERRVKPDNIF